MKYMFFLFLVNLGGVLPDIREDSPQKNLSILLLHSFFPSHCFTLFSLGAELTSRGHTVTAVGSVLEEYEQKMQTLLESNGMEYIMSPSINATFFDSFRKIAKFDSNDTLSIIFSTLRFIYNLTDLVRDQNYFIAIREVIDTLNASKYDYIIAEQAAAPLLYYVSDEWNTKDIMVLFVQLELTPRYIISWSYPRYGCLLTDNMSFVDRLLNTVVCVPVEKGITWLMYLLTSRAGVGKGFPSDMLSSALYQPVLYNTVIGGLEWPKTTLPLQHYVGPMFLPNPSPLDPTLSKWIQISPSPPIIFISMGTTAELTREMAEALLSLSEEYRLVWSLRESNHYVLDGLSVNSDTVYISPWVAQFTVLQHPSVVLAILHCGLNGVQEALYNEVPVLCVPYGIDQLDNAYRLDNQKLGISLAPKDVNKKNLREAVESLKGPVYQKKAKTISRLFKAGGGAKRGADLVELYAEVGYEHGLPSFIRYQWNSIQYYNIDVWVVLVALSLLFLWGCNKCYRYCCCCRRCCKKEKKTKRD